MHGQDPPDPTPSLGTAMPVSVALGDPDLAAEVVAHVESVLGWQVVAPGPHLPVRLALADTPDPAVPTAVVAWDPAPAAVAEAMRLGALDVLAWPADAARLTRLRIPGRTVPHADRTVRVAGAARGVGTTTTALALGGLLAWTGRRVAVRTGTDGVRMAGASPDRPDVEGVEGLAVHDDLVGVTTGPRPEVLVAEVGVGRAAEVVVARPDRALVRALARPPVAVITVGDGGMRPAELARVLGEVPHVALARSFRVARAGLVCRVPVGLPGAWLAGLRPLLAAVGADGGEGRR